MALKVNMAFLSFVTGAPSSRSYEKYCPICCPNGKTINLAPFPKAAKALI